MGSLLHIKTELILSASNVREIVIIKEKVKNVLINSIDVNKISFSITTSLAKSY